MRVLVCGGREYKDYVKLKQTLLFHLYDGDHTYYKKYVIISGGARGADSLAIRFAQECGIPLQVYYADWDKYGKAAGPIRNKEMLSVGKPDLVVAFPGGTGTAHMVKIAREAGIKVIEVGGE